MREKSATTDAHPALNHRCPFCHSDPGQLCRTHRGRGGELDHPHSRRIGLSGPAQQRDPAARVNALCCECGALRTVSDDYYSRRQDPNDSYSDQGRKEGWRRTMSLKCDACGVRTRHAVLNPPGAFRDGDERRQLIALGDSDTSDYPFSEEHIARLRQEYRQLFPRNPYLRHRYWTKEANQAWDDGSKKVIALCGEPITLECDPRQPSKKKEAETPGYLVADQLSDTEYEDPETGMWWIDMACVDCCRVSNNNHRAHQRKRLELFLANFARSPELIPDSHVGGLIETLEKLYDQAEKETP
ncbi:hypothetical protein hbim_05403 [Mycolicibacterium mageritense]|uniref:DNA-binding phage zinc finger domain-containing protein n=2 Tax=Mycolicibacterium mageritense TaxID=53462 RepID=A0AAI8XQU4_MYCME|nr:hypothetical protein hbim_05403 [Mycolicibacterium mageritense]